MNRLQAFWGIVIRLNAYKIQIKSGFILKFLLTVVAALMQLKDQSTNNHLTPNVALFSVYY